MKVRLQDIVKHCVVTDYCRKCKYDKMVSVWLVLMDTYHLLLRIMLIYVVIHPNWQKHYIQTRRLNYENNSKRIN